MSNEMRSRAVVTAGLCVALAGGAMLAPAVAVAEDAPIEQDVNAGDPVRLLLCLLLPFVNGGGMRHS